MSDELFAGARAAFLAGLAVATLWALVLSLRVAHAYARWRWATRFLTHEQRRQLALDFAERKRKERG